MTVNAELDIRAKAVALILERRVEQALKMLSAAHGINTPQIRIGRVKGHHKALGVYVSKDRTIYFAKADYLYDPFVVIHEFYHHLRSRSGKHRGTEKHADRFALSHIEAFNKLMKGKDFQSREC